MKYFKFLMLVLLSVVAISCTDDFDEINTSETGFTADEVSAKFFLTSAQVRLYAPDRFPYWRAHLIHSDRFAGHFTFGHNASWWSDGLSYSYNGGYTDATYNWLANHFGQIKGFADLTTVGGEFENQYMYAMAQIMKGLYFQMYTDTFGMVPYSEAGIDGILTPVYDAQKDIYKGIIAELDAAMATIGDAEKTGVGVDDAGSNDIYCGGDLQQWKRLANTLKLRIGMRALGSPGDDFASAAINSALSAPLLDESTGSVVMKKDFVISEWASASYGDMWHDFGTGGAANWTMGATLINTLKDSNDPRLAAYAIPAKGGSFAFTDDDSDPNFQQRLDFTIAALDASSADYTVTVNDNVTTLDVPAGQYIGQPTRTNGDTYPFMRYDMFSLPSGAVTHKRGTQVDAYPEIILTSAESYFLQAEAAVRGMGSGDANSLFQSGIREAMKLWNVSGDDYIANEDLADISVGTMDEKLEKIAIQRWLVSYTDGFEAWAVVRDTGYPAELAAGVSNPTIFELGTLNGAYPQRLRYGSNAQANPNYSAAISAQGPDEQATKLWFAQ
ncbi:SusD/RagB family nutrient-binding outer membrane lipoprotein [Yeosuana sp. MJ-SS3]|uniref:SusD/RagB family nutrient-binding outer membrane lipoprotein n=1 Tax=Gilvirhabdus luticola TaxID=3079858 RepID=A0ABU3U6J5_9FLAO|nr:SusD/RagB family nutrient-binding outer membrane lipoprotein [Yeosuana sp. MJ-SS3]MDU8886033.1 SusD/RagB family nutrient-binding outer membrane lipoprotein [Yeosuana sp. MJ-SS3]